MKLANGISLETHFNFIMTLNYSLCFIKEVNNEINFLVLCRCRYTSIYVRFALLKNAA
jgi:hypothetical protein